MTTAESPLAELASKSAGTMTFLGIAMVIFGALSMGTPLLTGIAIAYLAGILVLASGISQTFFAFKAGSLGKGLLAFVLGSLTILAGILLIGHPLLNLGFLTLLLIGFFLAEGIVEVIYAFQLRPTQGWIWTLIGGVVSILLAGMIWRQWPISGAWAIGLLVGIRLMFSGFAVLALAGAARAAARQVAKTEA